MTLRTSQGHAGLVLGAVRNFHRGRRGGRHSNRRLRHRARGVLRAQRDLFTMRFRYSANTADRGKFKLGGKGGRKKWDVGDPIFIGF